VLVADRADVMETWPAMVRVCRGLLGNRQDAEDCAAEAVVAVLADGRHEDARNVEAFMVTVARRRAVDVLRRRDREQRRAARLQAQLELAVPDLAEALVDQAEAQWLAQQARLRLTPPALAVLTELADGASVEQAAATLGMSRRSVESHLLRARRVLRGLSAGPLAVLGWLLAPFRRVPVTSAGPVTLTATAAAVLSLVLALPQGPSETGPPGPVTVRPLDGKSVVGSAVPSPAPPLPGAVPAGARVAPAPAGLVPEPPPAAPQSEAPAPSPVASVLTPAARVDVDSREDPAEGTVVEKLQHCVQSLQVSAEHIGC
jgi:RNA polymerase sigma factor (sigma-70 family)